VLHKQDVIDLLKRAELGLRPIQILAVMGAANIDDRGFVNYAELAPLAAEMVCSIWDQNTDLEYALYRESQAETGETLFGIDRQEVVDTVTAAFQQFDTDGNGTLDPTEFKNCINQTELLGRPLEQNEINAIIASVDENEDGKISYAEFMNLVLEVMQYFWEEENYAAQRSS
jgi:hypothetical protein